MKREQMDAIKVAINGRFECEHWHAGICDDCWEWVGAEIGASMNAVDKSARQDELEACAKEFERLSLAVLSKNHAAQIIRARGVK